ncbi:MAG: TRAP transporter small permease [Proteobacteria bacterium]|nr:TRAP transporter small permease [Pseudomonadota bacterium]MBU1712355.1 TRAP transporter small permease [Pseudomonadota bacterium]
MEIMNRINELLNSVLTFVGGIFLVAMVVLTCGNIFFRIVWAPVPGTYELMGLFGAIVTAFALGQTQTKRGHVAVDVLINTFSAKTKKALRVAGDLICMAFFSVVTWQLAVKAVTLWKTGELTETLRIIYYPFIYAVAFGCAVLTLVCFSDLLRALFSGMDGGK